MTFCAGRRFHRRPRSNLLTSVPASAGCCVMKSLSRWGGAGLGSRGSRKTGARYSFRKRTGSYYTPPEVVSAMVNLVDEALRGPLFERPAGFAASDVVVADPAVGTGTFLLGVLRRIAETVEEDQGAGAVRGAIEAAAKRIVGFEIQLGPVAGAQVRL